MSDDGWVRMKRGDDWGNIYYAPEVLQGRHRTASWSLGYRFKPGETLRTRWPDGTVVEAVVVVEPKTVPVSDMGHDYTVQTSTVSLLREVNGMTLRVPLQAVEIEAQALVGRERNRRKR